MSERVDRNSNAFLHGRLDELHVDPVALAEILESVERLLVGGQDSGETVRIGFGDESDLIGRNRGTGAAALTEFDGARTSADEFTDDMRHISPSARGICASRRH